MYRLHKSRVGLQNPVPQKGKALCSSGAVDAGARRAALSPLCLRSGHHLSSSSTTRLRRYFDGNGARAVTSRARMRWRQCGGGTCVELGSARNGKRQFLCLDFDPSCMESCFLLLQYWKIVIEFEICLTTQIFCIGWSGFRGVTIRNSLKGVSFQKFYLVFSVIHQFNLIV